MEFKIRHVGMCVANALSQAERLAAEDAAIWTVLFPMLGMGVAGASVTQTADELIAAAADHLAATPDTLLSRIYLLAYADVERAALLQALGGHPSLPAAA